MWGRPAVPNINARPRDIASMGSDTSPPGLSHFSPATSLTFWKRFSGENPNLARVHTVMIVAPPNRRTAFII